MPPKTKKRGVPPGEIEEKKKMKDWEWELILWIILPILGGFNFGIIFLPTHIIGYLSP